MSALHTPGPWSYENGNGIVACGNPLKVAGRTKVARANRSLIAAAPDLRDAASAGKNLFDMLRTHIANTGEALGDEDEALVIEWIETIRAAIAKAGSAGQ